MKKNLNPIYEAFKATNITRVKKPGILGKISDALHDHLGIGDAEYKRTVEDFISHKLGRKARSVTRAMEDRGVLPRFGAWHHPTDIKQMGDKISKLVSPKRWAQLKAEAERELQEYAEKIRKQYSVNPDYAQMVEDMIAKKKEELLRRARIKFTRPANEKLFDALHATDWDNLTVKTLIERTQKRIAKYKALAEKYGQLSDPKSQALAEKYRRLADQYGSMDVREYKGDGVLYGGIIDYFK